MKSAPFTFKDPDNIEIFVYQWVPEKGEIKGVIQLSHGMAEHAKRYVNVANALCRAGYVCFADDHRGHGKSIVGDQKGDLGPNGWEGTLHSIHELSQRIKKEYGELPFFYIGHSWGSLLGQDYIQRWGSEIRGCVLSGPIGKAGIFKLKTAQFFAKREYKKLGPDAPSQLLKKMGLSSFNKPWRNEKAATGFEWLTRDTTVVQTYMDDPLCGFDCPTSYFVALNEGFIKVTRKENNKKIPKNLPIYIIAGDQDPVGKKTKAIMPMIKQYRQLGISDVSYKFYKNGRHEMFNEINRDKVYSDLIDWLNSHL